MRRPNWPDVRMYDDVMCVGGYMWGYVRPTAPGSLQIGNCRTPIAASDDFQACYCLRVTVHRSWGSSRGGGVSQSNSKIIRN